MYPYDNTKVTVELRELIQSGIDIWAFDYPSYYKGDEKTAFERKVIDHFYFRQIGQETPARWLHYFRNRMREIMPYYLQLYETEALMKSVEDPFEAYNLTETYTEKTTGSETSEDTSSNTSETESVSSNTSLVNQDKSGSHSETIKRDKTSKFSDTPQGSIENLEDYLTNANIEDEEHDSNIETSEDNSETRTDNGSGTTETTASGTYSGSKANSLDKSYTLTRKGNIGVQPLGVEIEAYRKALINIDMMIINELNDLFLKVY